MQRIDGPTAVTVLAAPAAVSGTPGYFSNGDPSAEIPPTIVDADFLNNLQEEVIAVIVGAGIVPSKASHTQLRDAINTIAGGISLVSSVNGMSGAVVLVPADLGAVPDTRQVNSGGLVTGGGDLSANRTLTVPKALAAQIQAGTDDVSAITPKQLRDATSSHYDYTGYRVFEDGYIEQWGIGSSPGSETVTSIVFPIQFPTACFGIQTCVINSTASYLGETTFQEVSLSATGATLFCQNHQATIADAYGGFRWRAWGF
jgi:hypothetical protein